jgi:hypothetical protein
MTAELDPAQRAQEARRYLPRGFDSMHPDDKRDAITDMMADLLHLAHVENIDGEQCQRSAWHHFKAEIHESETAKYGEVAVALATAPDSLGYGDLSDLADDEDAPAELRDLAQDEMKRREV